MRDAKLGLTKMPYLLHGINPMDSKSIHAQYLKHFDFTNATKYRESCETVGLVAKKAVKETRAEEREVGNSVMAQMAASLPDILVTYDEEVTVYYFFIIHF